MPDKTTPDLNFSPKGLYIGGEWQESIDSGTFETINPSNLDKLGDVSRYRGPDTGKPKIRPSDSSGGKIFQWRCNLGVVGADCKVFWEMSAVNSSHPCGRVLWAYFIWKSISAISVSAEARQ